MNHETAVSNAKEIADRIIAPAARQNDREARFVSEAVAALGPSGLLGIMLPSEVGGAALPDHAAMRVLYSIEHRATVLRGVRDGSQAPKRDPPLP